MYKKLFLIMCLFLFLQAFAIEWLDLKSTKGHCFSLDKDSITQFENYYFYNIKTHKNNGDDVVMTMQFQKNHPFGARIKYYTPSEYEALNGDYGNIVKNLTKNLAPVSYDSRAFASYKKVHQIIHEKDKPQIVF